MDLLVEPTGEVFLRHLHVVVRLQVEPELRLHVEETAEAQGGVRSDGAAAMDDLVDPPWRNADVLGQPVLADAQRLQELRQQNLAGMDGGEVTFCFLIFQDLTPFPSRYLLPLHSRSCLRFTLRRISIVTKKVTNKTMPLNNLTVASSCPKWTKSSLR